MDSWVDFTESLELCQDHTSRGSTATPHKELLTWVFQCLDASVSHSLVAAGTDMHKVRCHSRMTPS